MKTIGQIHIDYALNGIEGLCTIMPAVHGDSRGYFIETRGQVHCLVVSCSSQLKRSGFSVNVLKGVLIMSCSNSRKVVRLSSIECGPKD